MKKSSHFAIKHFELIRIAAGAKLPVLLRGTDLHAGIFIVILAAIFTWWFLNRTTKGFEIKVTGQNRSFAKYIGINVASAMLLAQIIGGALGGIGGAVEILGKYDRFLWTAQTGYGFSGLMITVLARNNPIAIPFVTLLFAYLQIGANIVGTTTDVPSEFVICAIYSFQRFLCIYRTVSEFNVFIVISYYLGSQKALYPVFECSISLSHRTNICKASRDSASAYKRHSPIN